MAETHKDVLDRITADRQFRGSTAWAHMVHGIIYDENPRLATAWMNRRNRERLRAGVCSPGRQIIAIAFPSRLGTVVEFADSKFRQSELAFA